MITYNHNPYIIKAIEGVISQKTEFPIELIIGEDCSTDGTHEIVLEYEQRHPDIIRVMTSDANVGAKRNFKRCLDAARGKYLAHCEGDDYWHEPGKLQMQVDYLESHPECVMVHSDCDYVQMPGGERRENLMALQKTFPDEEMALRLLAYDYIVRTPTVCTRAEYVRKVREENPYEFSDVFLMGDIQTWIELSRLGTFHFIRRSLATMHRLPESATESKDISKVLRFRMSSLALREHYIARFGLSGPEMITMLRRTAMPMLVWAYETGDHKTALSVTGILRKHGYRLSLLESLYVKGARSRAMRRLLLPPILACLQGRRISRLLGRDCSAFNWHWR